MKRLLTIFYLAVLAAMLWVTVAASREQSVLEVLAPAWEQLWWRATLFDAYFAFLTVWLWIAYREANAWRAGGWLVAILLLGNFAIAAYFLLALVRLPAGASWSALFQRRTAAGPAGSGIASGGR